MAASHSVVVIGGGITGAFAAYFLARAGVGVTLIERDGVAAHASGANPGGLNPLHGPGIPGPLQDLALESFRLNLEHWEEIRERSGIDFSARFVSRLHVALDDAESAALGELADLHNATPGFSAEMLSRAELLRVEPRVTPQAVGALSVTGNACVDPAAYTRAVVAAAESLGARVSIGEAITVHAARERADAVVVAAGPWCEELGLPVSIEPVKGELLLVSAESGSLPNDVSRREVGVYAGAEGIWLGGTEDHAGFDETPTAEGRASILDKVSALLPGLGPVRVLRHVVGLRPATPDGMPVVGLPTSLANVCVATGGGRKGMLLGAALGQRAAELVAA
jgi:glycine oxidase